MIIDVVKVYNQMLSDAFMNGNIKKCVQTPGYTRELLKVNNNNKKNGDERDGKRKEWRTSETAHNQKQITPSVKHGGGSVIAQACGTVSATFNDDVTADRSSTMNCKVHRAVRSPQIQLNPAKPI